MKQCARDIAGLFGVGLYRLGNEDALIEPAHLRRFLRHFDIDCVFDVGANEGQYARRLRKLGFTGLILSFEPHPEIFKRLEEASRADPLWAVHEVALDAEARHLQFNLMSSTQFSSLHSPDNGETGRFEDLNKIARSVSVTTATLDDLFPQLRATYGFTRPFLKLDTQGHDLQVIKGGLNITEQLIGLQSELSIIRIYEDSPDFVESLSFYRSLGFKLSSLVPNNAGHFPDLVEMDCIMFRDTAR